MIKKFYTKNKPFNSEKGAIVAEASFIMPIVIVVIFILYYLALMQIQQAIMYMHAHEMAQKISKISTFAGYEKFYQEAYKGKDEELGLPETYWPSSQTIKEAQKVHDPYRYLGGIYLNKHNNYKGQLKEIIEKSMLFNSGVVDTDLTDIRTVFENLSTAVKVRVGYRFKLPKFVKLIGISPDILIKSEAIVYANDTAEFIRNTDLAFDFFDHFLKKYHLDKKINTFYKKIKEFSK